MTKSKSILKTNKDLPLIKDSDRSSILDSLILGKTSIEIAKDLQIPLTRLYKVLDQDANFKEQFGKSQEIGMRTLIEKMLMLFDNKPDNLEPADLLFLREKKDFLKWLAPKVSSFFIDKQQHQVKTDQTLTIKFDNGFDDKEVIDISEDTTFEMTPSDNKETD
tara:strand:- start:101 stop:589 length:489 start_codon:yes stop_codon:yes gene_type:complete